MGIIRSAAGMIEAELTGADLERSLGLIAENGYQLYRIKLVDEFTCRFHLRRSDYKKICNLVQKAGDSVKIVGRFGAYWTVERLKRRPVLLTVLVMLLSLALILPSRICFVQVEGNSSIPARLIIQRASECGICFGASRREVRSEKMKNALLSAIPELQWAGVNTKGCVAVISVREKTAAASKEAEAAVSRIVAGRDAVIVSCTVERGNMVCRVGQAVKTGDLLISGYTDCGIAIRASRAEGEIYGQTSRVISAVTPSDYTIQTEETCSQRKIALIIGKKRINFYKDSGILGTTCDKMSTVNYLTLPGGFVLPIGLVREKWIWYETENCASAEDREEKILTDFAEAYLDQQMLAGRILDQEHELTGGDGVLRLRSSYACIEMIGREQNEEILVDYGKSD